MKQGSYVSKVPSAAEELVLFVQPYLFIYLFNMKIVHEYTIKKKIKEIIIKKTCEKIWRTRITV